MESVVGPKNDTVETRSISRKVLIGKAALGCGCILAGASICLFVAGLAGLTWGLSLLHSSPIFLLGSQLIHLGIQKICSDE